MTAVTISDELKQMESNKGWVHILAYLARAEKELINDIVSGDLDSRHDDVCRGELRGIVNLKRFIKIQHAKASDLKKEE